VIPGVSAVVVRQAAKRPAGLFGFAGIVCRTARPIDTGRDEYGGEWPISTVEPRINERIRAPRVRLIGVDGEQLGIFATSDAQRMADDENLDLVEIAPNGDPPVAKVMDFGKFKYEEAIKAKKARKHQTTVQVKEIKFRPKIDKHDYETKKKHVMRFIDAGAKVKVTIMFRGREMVHAERGLVILERLAEDLREMALIENEPKLEGRNMFMLIAPTKKELPKVAKPAAPAPEASQEATETVEPEATVEAAPVADEPGEAAPAETPAPAPAETETETETEAAPAE
jgi:translation initiation factor IF-3